MKLWQLRTGVMALGLVTVGIWLLIILAAKTIIEKFW